jgi:hypothetical protein
MRTDQRTPRKRSRTGRTATIAAVAAALAVARIAASNRTTSTATASSSTRTSPTIDGTHTGVTPMRTEDHITPKRGWTGRLAGRTATIAAAAAALTVGGIAAANWTVAGSGSGAADASEVVNIEDIELSFASELFPGASLTGDLEITNPNPFPVRITGVEFTGSLTITPADPQPVAGTCDASNAQVAFVDKGSLSLVVPANDTETFELADVLTMGTGAANACQGAKFNRGLTITAVIDN